MPDDERLILRTLAEYGRWCDAGRFDEWADLFTEDARLVLGDHVTEGREAIRDLMATLQPDGRRGLHLTANPIVDIDGVGATAVSDYLFLRPTAAGPVPVAAGHYHDELVRHEDRWRFRRRAITILTASGAGPGA